MRRLVFFLGVLLSSLGYAASLDSVVLENTDGGVFVRCKFSGTFEYRTFTLSNPSRVILDLPNVKQGMQKAPRASNIALISNIRVGHPKENTLRLVFDANETMRVAHATPINNKNKHELLLTLKPREVLSMPAAKPPKALRDVVVVLDPGHGGKDPGAIGARKSSEKKVVLAIALKLKHLIDKQPGMRAVLTRDADYYVGLRERLNIARKHDADVFVSIHADAFIHAHSKGASVFALSQRGATSEAARWLAEKENNSELGGVNLSGLDDQNDVIRTVLIDLSQTATTTASLNMGSQVLKRLRNVTTLHSSDVEQARFVVLKSPDIPSILVETGFISNPKEEKNLNDAKYQARLTQAVFEGLKTYFWNHPPHGTQIEAMANAKLHIVRLGETLPDVAAHYHVKETEVIALNQLHSTRLFSGQNLNIPTRVPV
jgi:N-acetylmuramoyl-L-alanine amidase